jgi:hypothetical protein
MSDIGSFLADLAAKFQELGKKEAHYEAPKIEELYGEKYFRQASNLILPKLETVELHSLDGLMDYRLALLEQGEAGFEVCFKAERNAVVMFTSHANRKFTRPNFLYATAHPLAADLSFLSEPMDQEEAVVRIKTSFRYDEDAANLLKVLGTLVLEESVTADDDGVTQKVTARSGIALKEKIPLSAVVLHPYETFPEVQDDIPGRIYNIRVKKDGGTAWIYLHASKDPSVDIAISRAVKEYLVKRLVADGLEKQAAERNVMI